MALQNVIDIMELRATKEEGSPDLRAQKVQLVGWEFFSMADRSNTNTLWTPVEWLLRMANYINATSKLRILNYFP
jgi:hypothetical protein